MKTIQIENKQGKVKLTDAVTPFSVEKLTEEIGKLFGASAFAQGADFGVITNAAENAVDTLEIEINSPGGSIFDGYNIYREIESLRERGVEVTATVTGMAASMASVICMACNIVRIVPHGRMMIHEASQTVRGNSEDLRKSADLLDGISNDIAVIYSNKTGKSIENVRAMMKKETWMNAKESVELGFADEIFDIRATSPKSQVMNWLAKLLPSADADALSKLEAQVLESETTRVELETAQAKIAELQGLAVIVAEKDEEIKNLSTAKTDLEDRIADFTNQITAKDEEIKAINESIPAKISEALAGIGQPEPLNTGGESAPTDKSKTRKEFNAMSPQARLDFVKAGGKIK